MYKALENEITTVIQRALEEDRASEDVTTLGCIDENQTARAHILLKEDSVVAALAFLPLICSLFDNDLTTCLFAEEGSFCNSGKILAEISGKASSILSIERSLLNLMQRLSGIANLTAKCTKQAQGLVEILDTRKTTPGLRYLEKYATKVGGATNHRFHLEETILIKNNHLKLLSKSSENPIYDAITKAKRAFPKKIIEVEVDDPSKLQEALDATPDRILLDNMDPETATECIKKINKKAYVELSGGITLDNLPLYIATGADGISIGALTHSAKATDICLRIQ